MKYNKLTSADIKWITKLYASKEPRDVIQASIANEFKIKKRTVRRWASQLGRVDADQTDWVNAQKKVLQDKKYYIISWGQNSTPVHSNFLTNMEAYAEHIGAEISIIAGRYRNPTSTFPDKGKEYWVKEIKPYLDASRHTIHKYMEILADVKIHPTARMPLSSFEGVSSERSCIIGHPRVHQKVIAALNGYKPKMMLTTGACTVRNYTDSKAGKIGEFHHTLGFCIVEIDGDDFYVRQVTADENTGAFTDLTSYVNNGKVEKAAPIEAFIFGDIHVGDHDPECINATMDICDVLKPKVAVAHDLLNGHSVNRHEQKNPFARFSNMQTNNHTLKGEIDNVVGFTEALMERTENYCRELVVVNSNHDAWIEAYLINSDWKKDIPNALSYMKYATKMLQGYSPKGIFAHIVDDEVGSDNVRTLALDESYRISSWELGVHGHEGTNGSRGNPNQFKKLSTKMITGHTHSPSRIDGVVTVGTSTHLRVGYNTGASGWLQSHAILNADGKVQQLHCINYKFTTLI